MNIHLYGLDYFCGKYILSQIPQLLQTKIPVKVIDTLYRTNLNWEKLKGYPAANPELSFDQLKLYLDGSLKNIPIQIAN